MYIRTNSYVCVLSIFYILVVSPPAENIKIILKGKTTCCCLRTGSEESLTYDQIQSGDACHCRWIFNTYAHPVTSYEDEMSPFLLKLSLYILWPPLPCRSPRCSSWWSTRSSSRWGISSDGRKDTSCRLLSFIIRHISKFRKISSKNKFNRMYVMVKTNIMYLRECSRVAWTNGLYY